jgi:peptidoglycan hydrolase-like protein with peptidoglycan-binding domain
MRELLSIVLVSSLVSGCVIGEESEQAAGPAEATPDELASNAAAAPPPSSLVWPTTRRDDSNRAVVTAQYLLRNAGISVSVDGAFGLDTENAVRRFQSDEGLASDGVIGSSTWARLVVDVKSGDSNAAVAAVQDLLKNRYGLSLDVSGVFGSTTSSRVKTFQAGRCLASTGTVGLYTWHALVADRSYCEAGGSASTILGAHNAGTLTLWNETFGQFDGADPLSNIRDTVAGLSAKTSCYGNAPCTRVKLSSSLLDGMAKLRTQYGYRYFVTAISGATHSSGSLHYAGRAFDLDEVNGVRITGDSTLARQVMSACSALGAIEVLGPSNDAGHQDHIHCGW